MDCVVNKTIKNLTVSQNFLSDIVLTVLKHEKKDHYSLSVNLVGEKKIRTLNKLYRQIDKVTDVLSFAIADGYKIMVGDDLGDIFVCVPQIKRQAKANNISFKEELVRMLIHGCLHLLGYDHVKMEGQKKMFALQEKLLKQVI